MATHWNLDQKKKKDKAKKRKSRKNLTILLLYMVTCNYAKQKVSECLFTHNTFVKTTKELSRAKHLTEVQNHNNSQQKWVYRPHVLITSITLWTSTPVCTWDTAAAPAGSLATSRYSACGNSGNTDPRPAGSHPQALYL